MIGEIVENVKSWWKRQLSLDKLSRSPGHVHFSKLSGYESCMNADSRNLIIWLAMVCVVIYLMIVVGGVTRLTQSGLSMVDWQPIMGVFPPSNQEEWQATFDAYKQYPEYQFDRNKGYGTAAHRKVLEDLGPTPIHRHSFAPLRLTEEHA